MTEGFLADGCRLRQVPAVSRQAGDAGGANLGTRRAEEAKRTMDVEPLPTVLAAIERGRGRRGSRSPSLPEDWVTADLNRHSGGWSWLRAIILTMRSEGWSYKVIAEDLGISHARVGQLASEACDAVMRTPASSPEAEAACQRIWRWWCNQRGDEAACMRQ